MIRDICKDELFLARKAAPALPEDLPIAQDLLETLIAHKDGCVGMAANMIGVAKRIIAFESEDGYLVMFNPVILKKSGPYETEEGCLSLTGTRKTKRWQTIKVQWQKRKSSSPASRPSQAGQQRSSSTSSTTATASLSEITSGNAAKHSIPACLISAKISKSFTFYLLISFFRDGILIISHFDPIL